MSAAEHNAPGGGLTVRAAAAQLGVTPRTLKYYEELGLACPARSVGRYRLYDDKAIARFERILRLRAIGFSLQAISEILKRPLETPEDGNARLSQQSLTEIQSALQAQLQTLDQRIATVRRELHEAQTVRQELEYDLAYVAGRLAGKPIDSLLEQRRKHAPASRKRAV